MTAVSDPAQPQQPTVLAVDQNFFFIETTPLQCGIGLVKFRFVYNALGPHLEMNDGSDQWVHYKDFGLAGGDLYSLTSQDLDQLIELFKQGIWKISINAAFTMGYLPSITPNS